MQATDSCAGQLPAVCSCSSVESDCTANSDGSVSLSSVSVSCSGARNVPRLLTLLGLQPLTPQATLEAARKPLPWCISWAHARQTQFDSFCSLLQRTYATIHTRRVVRHTKKTRKQKKPSEVAFVLSVSLLSPVLIRSSSSIWARQHTTARLSGDKLMLSQSVSSFKTKN